MEKGGENEMRKDDRGDNLSSLLAGEPSSVHPHELQGSSPVGKPYTRKSSINMKSNMVHKTLEDLAKKVFLIAMKEFHTCVGQFHIAGKI